VTEPLPPDDPLKAAWLSQPVEPTKMSTVELAVAAVRFEEKIRRRNQREYVAGAFLIPIFAWILLFGHQDWIAKASYILGILGVVFILWQLHLRTRPLSAPIKGSPENLLAFQRAELVRQRDALRAVPLWYLAPLTPCFVVMGVGRWIHPNPRIPLAEDHARLIGGGVLIALIYGGVGLLNVLAARRLDREVGKIDRLSDG
jgi:hypothetical protein